VANGELAAALGRLDDITRRLRRECPWDREQDERSIVPHTVEEAYELADAAHRDDDAKLLDELGDVLFQVFFLALLLEERGRGSLVAVAEGLREKLIRRHPHVFGQQAAETAAEVLAGWGRIKREEERGGEVFGELPEILPSTLYARKVLRRAASAGLWEETGPQAALARVGEAAAREPSFEAAGDVLLAAVEVAGAFGADPEIALRRAADRFRARTEEAG
jgi:XTP/dITP diphosphohydrolase/tetrapyrrole methylase family protein/MazG family protein/ATP diphosphatase